MRIIDTEDYIQQAPVGDIQIASALAEQGVIRPLDTGKFDEAVKGLVRGGREIKRAFAATGGEIGIGAADRAYERMGLEDPYTQDLLPAPGAMNEIINEVSAGVPELGKTVTSFSAGAALAAATGGGSAVASATFMASVFARSWGGRVKRGRELGLTDGQARMWATIGSAVEAGVERGLGPERIFAGAAGRFGNKAAGKLATMTGDQLADKATRMAYLAALRPTTFIGRAIVGIAEEIAEEAVQAPLDEFQEWMIDGKWDLTLADEAEIIKTTALRTIPAGILAGFMGGGINDIVRRADEQRVRNEPTPQSRQLAYMKNGEITDTVQMDSAMTAMGEILSKRFSSDDTKSALKIIRNISENLASMDETRLPEDFANGLTIAFERGDVDVAAWKTASGIKDPDARMSAQQDVLKRTPGFGQEYYRVMDRAEAIRLRNENDARERDVFKRTEMETAKALENIATIPKDAEIYAAPAHHVMDKATYGDVYKRGVVRQVMIDGKSYSVHARGTVRTPTGSRFAVKPGDLVFVPNNEQIGAQPDLGMDSKSEEAKRWESARRSDLDAAEGLDSDWAYDQRYDQSAMASIEQAEMDLRNAQPEVKQQKSTQERVSRVRDEAIMRKDMRDSGIESRFSAGDAGTVRGQYDIGLQTMRFYQTAMAADVVHEWFHHITETTGLLPSPMRDALMRRYAEEGKWDGESAERAVQDFLGYVRSKQVPDLISPDLLKAFEHMRKVMASTAGETAHMLSDDTLAMFDAWFGMEAESADFLSDARALADRTSQAVAFNRDESRFSDAGNAEASIAYEERDARFRELTKTWTPGGDILYRSESARVDDPGTGAIFYTSDKSYADIYHGEGRVMRTARMPTDLIDVRTKSGRDMVRSWIVGKLDQMQQESDDGSVSGISGMLRDARRFLNADDTPQNVGSAMANIGMAIGKAEGRASIPVGLAEKRFLTDVGRTAMTVPEHARSVGQEFSIAFRDASSIEAASAIPADIPAAWAAWKAAHPAEYAALLTEGTDYRLFYHAKTKGDFKGGKMSADIGSDADIMGKGLYIASDRNYVAASYGEPIALPVKANLASTEQWTAAIARHSDKRVDAQRAAARAELREQGYDGVLQTDKRGDVGVIWNQSVLDQTQQRIDAVAPDDTGRIPGPSEWGDAGNADIRFSITQPTTRADANKALHAAFRGSHEAVHDAAVEKFGVASMKDVPDADLIAWAQQMQSERKYEPVARITEMARAMGYKSYGSMPEHMQAIARSHLNLLDKAMNQPPMSPEVRANAKAITDSIKIDAQEGMAELAMRPSPASMDRARPWGGPKALEGVYGVLRALGKGITKAGKSAGEWMLQTYDTPTLLAIMSEGNNDSFFAKKMGGMIYNMGIRYVKQQQASVKKLTEMFNKNGISKLPDFIGGRIVIAGIETNQDTALAMALIGRGNVSKKTDGTYENGQTEALWRSNGQMLSGEDQALFENMIKDSWAKVESDKTLGGIRKSIDDFLAWEEEQINASRKERGMAPIGRVKGYFPVLRKGGLFWAQDPQYDELLNAGKIDGEINPQASQMKRRSPMGQEIKLDAMSVLNVYRKQADIFVTKEADILYMQRVLDRMSDGFKRAGMLAEKKALYDQLQSMRYHNGRSTPFSPGEMAIRNYSAHYKMFALIGNVSSAIRQTFSLATAGLDLPFGASHKLLFHQSRMIKYAVMNMEQLKQGKNMLDGEFYWDMMVNGGSVHPHAKHDPAVIDIEEAVRVMSQWRFLGLPAKDAAMLPQRFFDQITRTASWAAAYETRRAELTNESMTDAKKHEIAFRFAEENTTATQPAAGFDDRALIQKGNEFVRTMIPFTGDLFKRWNIAVRHCYIPSKNAFNAGMAKGGHWGAMQEMWHVFAGTDYAKQRYGVRTGVGHKMMYVYVMPAMAMGMLSRGRPYKEIDEFWKDLFAYNMAIIPIFGPVISGKMLYEGFMTDGAPVYYELINGIGDMFKHVRDGDLSKLSETGLREAAKATGFPNKLLKITQDSISGEYLDRYGKDIDWIKFIDRGVFGLKDEDEGGVRRLRDKIQ